jgi:UDP-N-acetylmuramate--alanine ligase
MKLKTPHIIYFLGIGGIGMSALARYYQRLGSEIHGYDRTETALTQQLAKEGMHIHYNENASLIPADTDLVVYTPAIPDNNLELVYCQKAGIRLLKRAQLLGELTQNHYTIAVAGTHGKTSITSTIAHLLNAMGKQFTAFIGGISNNFNSNLVFHPDSEIMLVEADEYDQSFLQLKPDVAVVSSIDPDHLDIYENYTRLKEAYGLFVDGLTTNGCLVKNIGLNMPTDKRMITYGFDDKANVSAKNIQIKKNRNYFDLNIFDIYLSGIEIGVPGKHNVENALAALAVLHHLGADLKLACHALATYKGVKRRFDIRINGPDLVYIDDYAHHPAELKACISAVRELYPGKCLTGIFQPHLFSRTRDLMPGFVETLAMLDELILLEIYPARELPIKGVDSKALFDQIKMDKKYLCSSNEVLNLLQQHPPQVLLTLGAGDIDKLVEPIEKMLEAL